MGLLWHVSSNLWNGLWESLRWVVGHFTANSKYRSHRSPVAATNVAIIWASQTNSISRKTTRDRTLGKAQLWTQIRKKPHGSNNNSTINTNKTASQHRPESQRQTPQSKEDSTHQGPTNVKRLSKTSPRTVSWDPRGKGTKTSTVGGLAGARHGKVA